MRQTNLKSHDMWCCDAVGVVHTNLLRSTANYSLTWFNYGMYLSVMFLLCAGLAKIDGLKLYAIHNTHGSQCEMGATRSKERKLTSNVQLVDNPFKHVNHMHEL
jgi:hypothetical protein